MTFTKAISTMTSLYIIEDLEHNHQVIASETVGQCRNTSPDTIYKQCNKMSDKLPQTKGSTYQKEEATPGRHPKQWVEVEFRNSKEN